MENQELHFMNVRYDISDHEVLDRLVHEEAARYAKQMYPDARQHAAVRKAFYDTYSAKLEEHNKNWKGPLLPVGMQAKRQFVDVMENTVRAMDQHIEKVEKRTIMPYVTDLFEKDENGQYVGFMQRFDKVKADRLRELDARAKTQGLQQVPPVERFLYDYELHRVINFYNTQIDNGDSIFTTQARAMAQRFDGALKKEMKGKNLDEAARSRLCQTIINDLFSERQAGIDGAQYVPFKLPSAGGDSKEWKAMASSFYDYIRPNAPKGISKDDPAYWQYDDASLAHAFVPVSGFNRLWSNLQVMQDAGNEMVFVPVRQLNSLSDLFDSYIFDRIPVADVTIDRTGGRILATDLHPDATPSMLMSTDDVTGLSRLARYMDGDPKKLAAIREHLGPVHDAGWKFKSRGKKAAQLRVNRAMIANAETILDWMNDTGKPCHIEMDMEAGQLKMVSDGIGSVQVRILDRPENASFVGRCYMDGWSRFMYEVSSSNAERLKNRGPLPALSPKAALDLVKSAFGEEVYLPRSVKEPVMGKDGKPVIDYDGRQVMKTVKVTESEDLMGTRQASGRNTVCAREYKTDYGEVLFADGSVHQMYITTNQERMGGYGISGRTRLFLDDEDRALQDDIAKWAKDLSLSDERKAQIDAMYWDWMKDPERSGWITAIADGKPADDPEKAEVLKAMNDAGKLSDQDIEYMRILETSRRAVPTASAQRHIISSVMTARENLMKALDVEGLLQQYEAHKDDPDYVPDFVGEPAVTELQEEYWNVLTTRKERRVFKPGMDEESYKAARIACAGDPEKLEELREKYTVNVPAENYLLKPDATMDQYKDLMATDKEAAQALLVIGKPADVIREHARLYVDEKIGTVSIEDLKEHRIAIDPAAVCAWQDGANNRFRNSKDLVSALRTAGITSAAITQDDFENSLIKEQLVSFTPALSAAEIEKMKADIAAEPDPEFRALMQEALDARKEWPKPLAQLAEKDEFVKDVYDQLTTTFRMMGAKTDGDGQLLDKDKILIDEKGIVDYHVALPTIYKVNSRTADPTKREVVHGQIGQILIPDERGLVQTQFEGKENYWCAPGYRAMIQRQKPGENLSLGQRTMLKGYRQLLMEQIRVQIPRDMLAVDGKWKPSMMIGSPSSVNSVLRQLYDDRYPLDFMKEWMEAGKSQEEIDACLSTMVRACRYDSDQVQRSGIIEKDNLEHANADWEASHGRKRDHYNDCFDSPMARSGYTNMEVLEHHVDGYFDPQMSGAAGKKVYLVKGARVLPDGHIEKDTTGSRTPMIQYLQDECQSQFDAADRVNMDASNALTSYCLTKPVKCAMMTLGGYNQDDGIIVSRRFAESYKVPYEDADGNRKWRSLKLGDKLCAHGNKGVISLIVDGPSDTDRQGDAQIREAKTLSDGHLEIYQLFEKNPDMDVVMAPFSGVSRFNGGVFREGTRNTSALVDLDGRVHEGGLFEMRLMVTDKTADEKTKSYSENDLKAGRGRKISSQLVWALHANDCDRILKECFEANSAAYSAISEYMNVWGFQLDPDSTIRSKMTADHMQKRNVFSPEELPAAQVKANKSNTELTFIDRSLLKNAKERFGNQIAHKGGYLEVPFDLKLASGNGLPVVREEQGKKTYALPLLSSHLRCGRDLESGTSSVHDYTSRYMAIYEAVIKYEAFDRMLRDPDEFKRVLDRLNGERKSGRTSLQPLSPETFRNKAKAQLERLQETVQKNFDYISNDLQARKLDKKDNMFKMDLMCHKMSRSATAVWVADPRLDLDEMGISPAIAESMGVRDGQTVMIWRDPILRDQCVKAVTVREDPDLTGVSVNPCLASAMDGDFDGDSIGVLKLNDPDAVKQLEETFHPSHTMFDFGSCGFEKNADGTENRNGKKTYQLAYQTGLDIQVAHSFMEKDWNELSDEEKGRWDRIAKPETMPKYKDGKDMYESMKADWASLDADLQELAGDIENMRTSGMQRIVREKALFEKLNEHLHECHQATIGVCVIDMKTPESYIMTLEDACVKTGAKGNYDKVETCAHYAGIEYERVMQEDGKAGPMDRTKPCVLHEDRYMVGRQEDIGQQFSQSAKTAGTPKAGTQSQHGIRALRGIAQKIQETIDGHVAADPFLAKKAEKIKNHYPFSPLQAIMEATYVNTQKILQCKHDPDDARRFLDEVMHKMPRIWSGYKLDEKTGEPVFISGDPEKGEGNKRYAVRATRDQWVSQAVHLYRDVMKIEINPKMLELVADSLVDEHGLMPNIEDKKFIRENAMTMDQGAYKGSLAGVDLLRGLARNDMKIFDGVYADQLAPNSVREQREPQTGLEKTIEDTKMTEAGKDAEKTAETKQTRPDRTLESDVQAGMQRRLKKSRNMVHRAAVVDLQVGSEGPEGPEIG